MSEIRISLPAFLRHLAAFSLLMIAWHLVSLWYLHRRFSIWVLFAICCIAAIALAANSLRSSFRKLRFSRVLSFIPIALLLLPWAEWLNITPASSRQTWSRQILKQGMFVYVVFIALDLFPAARRAIHKGMIRFLDLVSHKYATWFVPILFFLLTTAISLWVINRTPFLQDSAAHLFQAKIFRELQLNAPEPPLPQFYNISGDMLVLKDGRWFSMYQPGFALLLAASMLFSAEWLLSPLMGSLIIAVWMLYAKRWHGTRTSILFGLIALVSPFLLIMSATIMVYTPELFFASLAIFLCRAITEKNESGWYYFSLFIVLIGGMLVRSFSSLIFLAPLLIYTAWKTLRRGSYVATLAILSGIIVGGSLLLFYQSRTTGNPFLSGYFLEYPALKFGFGENNHTPAKGLANLSNHLLSLNEWLTGWYSGSLLFLFIFWLTNQDIKEWDWLLMAGCLSILIFYFFHVHQDLLIGPRYYYILTPFLLLLLTRSAAIETPGIGNRTIVLPLLGISLLSFLPLKFPETIDQYQIASTFPGNLQQELKSAGQRKLLIFLDKTVPPYFVNWNDPFLRGPAIICLDRGDQNTEIMKLFPDHRSVYFRPDLVLNKLQMKMEYKFFEEPNRTAAGYISMFQLVLAVQTTAGYEDRNFFDVCYDDLLKGDSAAQLSFVRNQLAVVEKKISYKEHFHQGLLHTAALLLVPKVAYDNNAQDWTRNFDCNAYRRELDLAEQALVRAGPIGTTILSELQKVRSRIDRDRNGLLSDRELTQFLDLQLSVFHPFGM